MVLPLAGQGEDVLAVRRGEVLQRGVRAQGVGVAQEVLQARSEAAQGSGERWGRGWDVAAGVAFFYFSVWLITLTFLSAV